MDVFKSAFGIHERALAVRSQRMEVIARNIANADTPNYKAQDIDFKAMLFIPSKAPQDFLKNSVRHDTLSLISLYSNIYFCKRKFLFVTSNSLYVASLLRTRLRISFHAGCLSLLAWSIAMTYL